jgi:hypothetical protein
MNTMSAVECLAAAPPSVQDALEYEPAFLSSDDQGRTAAREPILPMIAIEPKTIANFAQMRLMANGSG